MSGFNLPPGCSVSDIPGNSQADADWENACQIATAIMQAANPRLVRWEGVNKEGTYVVRPGLLTDGQADILMESIANAILTAYDNGRDAGIGLGKMEARMEAIENQETS